MSFKSIWNPPEHPTYPRSAGYNGAPILLGDVFTYKGYGNKHFVVAEVRWNGSCNEFWVIRAGLHGEPFGTAASVYFPEHMRLVRRAPRPNVR